MLFAGGGTGGHTYMAVALARELQNTRPGVEFLFVDGKRGVGKRILEAFDFPLKTIPVGGLKGTGWGRRIITLVQLPGSLAASAGIIRGFDPGIIVGLGGYASGPVLAAGRILGVPLLLIEPNVVPGLANRIAGRFAQGVAVAFEVTAARFGTIARRTGVPVREEFYRLQTAVSREGPLRLLVFGGSQGSRPINRLVCEALPLLPAGRFHVVHQTGLADCFAVRKRHQELGLASEVVDFIEDMPARFDGADLVLCRAGASTIAELTAAGKASVLIPFPGAADDHQRRNAEVLAGRKAAVLLDQAGTDGEKLASLLIELERDRERLERMSEAARTLARIDSRRRIVEFMEELSR